MIGVMSICRHCGNHWRSGRSIGSLTAYDHRIHGEYGEIGSHELTTRTRIAILRKSNVQRREA